MDLIASRNEILLEKLLLVNGQPGCGKTLFTSFLPSIPRVELLNYSTEIENICILHELGKISKDGALSFIKCHIDEVLYNTCMSRKTNFRIKDLSSVFQNPYKFKYFLRLLSDGDQRIPDYIKKNKPILHFATHNLLPMSKILFEAFNEKIAFIEILRKPIYMIKQQFINYENHKYSNRYFHIKLNFTNKEFFHWDFPYAKNHTNYNSIDFAIQHLNYQLKKQISEINIHLKKRTKNLLVIPFDEFVLNPKPYLSKVENLLGDKFSKKLDKILKREKVPRKKVSDGVDKFVYRRYGWEKSDKNLDEEMEIQKRIEFVKLENPKEESLKKLDESIRLYENFIEINNNFI